MKTRLTLCTNKKKLTVLVCFFSCTFDEGRKSVFSFCRSNRMLLPSFHPNLKERSGSSLSLLHAEQTFNYQAIVSPL